MILLLIFCTIVVAGCVLLALVPVMMLLWQVYLKPISIISSPTEVIRGDFAGLGDEKCPAGQEADFSLERQRERSLP